MTRVPLAGSLQAAIARKDKHMVAEIKTAMQDKLLRNRDFMEWGLWKSNFRGTWRI